MDDQSIERNLEEIARAIVPRRSGDDGLKTGGQTDDPQVAQARGLGKDELLKIRVLFDDPEFVPGLRTRLQSLHNSPQRRAAIVKQLTAILRGAEEWHGRLESQRSLLIPGAVGLGASLMVGGMIAISNPVVGLAGLVFVVGGVVVKGAGWFGVRRLDEERIIFKQIADRVSVILKAIET